jgi:hypothetical protein
MICKKNNLSGHGRTIYIFWIELDFKHSFHGVFVISLRSPGQVSMSGQSSIKTYLPGVTTLPALLKNHYYYQDDVQKYHYSEVTCSYQYQGQNLMRPRDSNPGSMLQLCPNVHLYTTVSDMFSWKIGIQFISMS